MSNSEICTEPAASARFRWLMHKSAYYMSFWSSWSSESRRCYKVVRISEFDMLTCYFFTERKILLKPSVVIDNPQSTFTVEYKHLGCISSFRDGITEKTYYSLLYWVFCTRTLDPFKAYISTPHNISTIRGLVRRILNYNHGELTLFTDF